MRKPVLFAYAKTKVQNNALVSATKILQSRVHTIPGLPNIEIARL